MKSGIFIYNEFLISDKFISVINPVTEKEFEKVCIGGAIEVNKAVDAAVKSHEKGIWKNMTPNERGDILYRLAILLENNVETFAEVESLNTGKPLFFAKNFEIKQSVNLIKFYAGIVNKIYGKTSDVSLPGENFSFSIKEPVGVVALITPWNVPLMALVTKLAPALAAGCSIVFKPSEITPLTAILLCDLIKKAGVPAGVVNMVVGTGFEVGVPLVEHKSIDKISFTGSTTTGSSILKSAANNIKKATVELGGKSPILVFNDADIEKAAVGIFKSICSNSGQFCAAGTRMYVDRRISRQLIEKLEGLLNSVNYSQNGEDFLSLGPMISKNHMDKVRNYIFQARVNGLQVFESQVEIPSKGYFVKPCLIVGESNDGPTMQEEIFGPVLSILVVDMDDLDSLIKLVNNNQYALSSYIWTTDIAKALRVAKRIQAGMVRINTHAGADPSMPFGGNKKSGFGRENGFEGLEEYMSTKSVNICID